MTEGASFAIGEIAEAYQVSLRTLRYYEERGLLTPSRAGHSRRYSAADQTRLRLILHARRLGFTLTEIARIIAGRDATAEQPAGTPGVLSRTQIEAQIALLEQRRDMAAAAIAELRAALPHARGAEPG